MHIRAILGVGLLGVVWCAAFAAPPTDPSFIGKWTATAESPGGNSIETLTVVRVGKNFSVTGKAAVPPPPGMLVSDGQDVVLEGNRFSYKRTMTAGGGEIVISYSGVVSGDTFTGTADIGGTKVPYNGVRLKEKG